MTDPTPTSPSGPDNELQLTDRDAHIHRVLNERDPELAGLFLYVVRFRTESTRAGALQMLCHAGRELSLGVLEYLADEQRPLSSEQLNTVDQEREANRVTIARALRLDPHHPSVGAWLHAHNELVACAHYPRNSAVKPSSREAAITAANSLVALIWSRIGPFFRATEDLERLLAIEVPTPQDLSTLHVALARPAARRDFFRRLEQPGWVAPLCVAGFFKHPPDVLPPDKDGRQSFEGWSEGDFLRRMASKAPADVRDALQAIPTKLRNPYVWDGAAEAAKAMPAKVAVTLVPLFRTVLKSALPLMIQETFGELAARLAEAGEPKALVLARGVLRVVEGPKSSLWSMLEDGVERREAVLYGLDEYGAEQVIKQLIEALPKLDDYGALKLFIGKLNNALCIEWVEPDKEPIWASGHWCPDLSEARGHHGFKEHLAVAIARIASDIAVKSPEDAATILLFLTNQQWRVYGRMRLLVLAKAGHNAPEQLNAVVADTQLVQDEYPDNEYLLLVESQFQNASNHSRGLVIDAILQGPGSDQEIIASLSEHDEEREPTLEDARKSRIRWQRKRLRRFGPNVPVELRDLATRLDADPSVPKPKGHELELEDKGSSGEFAWSAGPRSPLTSAELKAMSPEQILDYLRSFKWTRENFESPTPAGLTVELASRIREEPQVAAALAALVPTQGIERIYVRGILEGLNGAVQEGRDIAWREVLPLVEWVAQQGNDNTPSPMNRDYGDADWQWAQQEAAKLVSHAAVKNLAMKPDGAALWQAAEALINSQEVWKAKREVPKTMDEALMAALNTVAGKSAEALLDVALWNYRLSQAAVRDGEGGGVPAADTSFPFQVDRLRVGIDSVLSREGSSAYPARVKIGEYLPQLLLMDRSWILERTSEFFEDGFEPPLTNPVWGGYITRQNLFNRVFQDLRAWYVRAAEGLPHPDSSLLHSEQKDSTWSPTRHLVVHSLVAHLRGLASVTDADRLLPLVFERSSIADRSHAYWEIFRGWKGKPGSGPDEMRSRLLQFWSWRLDVLSTRAETESKTEAAALGWLALATALTDEEVLPLLSLTTQLADGQFPMEHSMWGRLKSLTDLDPDRAITIVERIVRAELKSNYPHFAIADVGPALQAALRSKSQLAVQKATDLVDLLGDNGFSEFGSLR